VAYKISASLLNSWIYYKNDPCTKNFDSFVESLRGEFKGNVWTERGNIYESEVFQGKHGKVSKLVESLPKQVWCNRYIDVDGLRIKISGKMDVVDHNKKVIYDIKRTTKFSKDKYDDSMQHVLYFFLNPIEYREFYYIVAYDNEDSENGIDVGIIRKTRPDEKDLEKTVINTIKEFFKFLKERDLWEIYKEKQQTRKRGSYVEKN
jgi:hypothetical protein